MVDSAQREGVMRRVSIAIGMAGLVVLGAARVAEACSGELPGSRAWAIPNESSSSVPTNTRILVGYSGGEDVLSVRVLGGADVEVDRQSETFGASGMGLVTLTPRRELIPFTTYEVLDAAGAADAGTSAEVVATFTTGAGPDRDPPVFAGIGNATAGEPEVCEYQACCGPYRGREFTFVWDEALDASTVIYRLIRDDTGEVIQAGAGTKTVGWFACPESARVPLFWRAFRGQSGRYRVRAVDLAGNAEGNERTIEVVLDCSDIPAYEGRSRGCATASGLAPLLLVIAVARRRSSRWWSSLAVAG